mgnify:CR=1 FL=1
MVLVLVSLGGKVKNLNIKKGHSLNITKSAN